MKSSRKSSKKVVKKNSGLFSLLLLALFLVIPLLYVHQQQAVLSQASGPVAVLYGKSGTFGTMSSIAKLPSGQSFKAVSVSNWGFAPGESEFFAALGSDGQVIMGTDPQTDNEVFTTANQMNLAVFNPATNKFSTIVVPTSKGYKTATNPYTTPPNIVGGADIGAIVSVGNNIYGVSDVPYSEWDTATYGEYPSFFRLKLSSGQWVYDASHSKTSDALYAQSSLGQFDCAIPADWFGRKVPACGFGEMNALPGSQYLIAANYFPDGTRNAHSGRITAFSTDGIIQDVFTYPDIKNASGSALNVSLRSVVVDPNLHTDAVTSHQLAYFIILFDATDPTVAGVATSPIQMFAFDMTTKKISAISAPVFTGQKDPNGTYYRTGPAWFDANGNIWVNQGVSTSMQGGPTVVYTKKADGTTSLETTCKQVGTWSTWDQTCAPDTTVAGSDQYGSPWNFTEDKSNHMLYETTLAGFLLRYKQSGSDASFAVNMLSPIDIGLGYLRTNGRYIGIRNAIVDQKNRVMWIPVNQTQTPSACAKWPCTPTTLDQWLYKFDLNALAN